MERRLAGQIVLITGAARGLGRGVALRVTTEGATVAVADLQSCEQTLALIQEQTPGIDSFASRVDVTDASAVARWVNVVIDRFGRIDVLVNNAGTLPQMMAIADTPDAVFDHVMNVNVRGVFNGCRAAARVMREQRSGCVINIGSWYGKLGFANFALYCASKAAVIRMTESLALELAPYGARANSICPGNMATEMHFQAVADEAKLRGISFEEMDRHIKQSIPLGTQGTPDDIGAAVTYLASADGAYLTGQALNVNGGILFS